MKNITLAIEEEVLERARSVAVERKTTVNAMVRAFLAEQGNQNAVSARRREAAARLLALSRNSLSELPKDWKFDREDVYAERLHRLERDHLRGGGGTE